MHPEHHEAVPAEGPASSEPVGGPSLDMVTAALRADSADVAIYARVLTESLGDALPAGCVTIDRARSMSDRMHGRPGQVSKITVRLGEQVLSLGVQTGREPETSGRDNLGTIALVEAAVQSAARREPVVLTGTAAPVAI